MKKIKLIISGIIIGITLNSSQAGELGIIKNPIGLSALGAGTVLYLGSVTHKARYLSFNLIKVDDFFRKNPQDYTLISNYVFKALENPASKMDYDRYKKLAEVMGLSKIPAYIPPKVNNPELLINPIQEKNDNTYLINPINHNPVNNIIYTPQGTPINTSIEFPIEEPKSYEDYLLLKQNSQILADNMEKAGAGKKPSGYAAHHIVPATDLNAQSTRNILIGHGIDINDAENGVYLPTPQANNATQGIEHNGRHPQEYITQVQKLIDNANLRGGKQEVLKELNDIKNKLQNAPLNSNWRTIL